MAAFSQRVIVPDEIVHPTSMLALDENIMADHLEQFLEAEDNKQRNFVFSSPLSSGHVYCFAPSAILNRNYWTLVTMGMSGTRMNVPSDIDHPERLAHAEVNKSVYYYLFIQLHDIVLSPNFEGYVLFTRKLHLSPCLGWSN